MSLGVAVQLIELDHQRARRGGIESLRRAVAPSEAELYPSILGADAVRSAIADVGAEVVFAYNWDAVAATRTTSAPRFGAVGDPSHLPELYRLWHLPKPVRVDTVRRVVRVQGLVRRQPRMMARFLSECAASGAFAAHHAAWLRGKGAWDCAYLHTPIPDTIGQDWRSVRDAASSRDRPRLLLMGHLHGIVTLEGLRLFAEMVLPELDRRLGLDAYEVHIVGGYEPPPDLRRQLDRPNIHFLGQLNPADDAFVESDLLIVPNSLTLGVRVRVLTGFSFGCCIVSHSANKLGIPELTHGINALIADDGPGIAASIASVLEDKPLRRRLEAGARLTYEQHFSQETAGGAIEARLMEVAR